MPATQEYQHSEAFCVMKYASDDGNEIEFIWNSRDGVTPFVIPMRSGQEGRHVDWSMDTCVPDYHPAPGTRVFVDTSPESYRQYAVEMVEKYWEGVPGYPKMSDNWETKEAAIAALSQEGTPGSPSMVEAEEYLRQVEAGTLYLVSPVATPPRHININPAGDDRFA